MQNRTIGVIGAGASGMTAAIAAARQGAEVTLLEQGERVGKKILSTGNGKCNLGNADLRAEYYHGADIDWIGQCLESFGIEETQRFFAGIGLMIKERNGYYYPESEQASAVLDVLRAEVSRQRIRLLTGCKVETVVKREKGFDVTAGDKILHFDRVILACGGRAAPKTGSDGSGYRLAQQLGHRLVPTVPALVQLRCSDPFFKAVAGVRAQARIKVPGLLAGRELSEEGELQLTDYGISGIPVFQLSREVNYLLAERGKKAELEVAVDLLPGYSDGEYRQFVLRRKKNRKDRTVEEFFTGMLHKKLMTLFVKTAGLKPDEPADRADEGRLDRVFALCRDWRVHVNGSNSYDSAQVCAGGVDTAQVDPDMESKLVPGLFFAGEILDVDGRCGGYNLQWAWSSGYLAGEAAAEKTR